jgi:hypothetical protein
MGSRKAERHGRGAGPAPAGRHCGGDQRRDQRAAARLQLAALSWRAPVVGWLSLELERRTPFPWIAVAFGLGILLFFQAEGRPALWAPVAGFLLATAAAVALRGRVLAFGIAVGCAAVFAGFTAGLLRLDAVRRRCSTGAYRQAHRIRRERRGAP